MDLKEDLFFGGGKVVQFELLSHSPLILRLSELIRKYSVSKQGLIPISAQAWKGHLGAERTLRYLQLVEVRNASARHLQLLGRGPRH